MELNLSLMEKKLIYKYLSVETENNRNQLPD